MPYALPSRIMDYRVSASSPTAELFALGQIFSEVGAYASAIFDRSHLAMARKCATRLKRVVSELMARNCIQSADDLHNMPAQTSATTDLRELSIDELYGLYRLRSARQDERAAEGREVLTYYFERQIVREMLRRKAENKEEQLKIDYCSVTYGNELENLSAIFALPVKIGNKAYPDPSRQCTAEELETEIVKHLEYRDIADREILIEYADMAIDLMARTADPSSCLSLITELAEIGREGIIRIPKWLNSKLQQALAQPAAGKSISRDAERAVAMLTLQMINGDPALERKATRQINRCYKAALDPATPLDARIAALHTAVTCSDYVTRYSPRAASAALHEITTQVHAHTHRQTFQLHEIGAALNRYIP